MKISTITNKLLFSILILTAFTQLKAQNEWIPKGATWHYQCLVFAGEGYQKLYYNKDTFINGLEFKTIASKMVIYDHLNDTTKISLNENAYFLREDSNIVYWYHEVLDTIYVLYNFNSSLGETWKIPPDPFAGTYYTDMFGPYTTARVDSIDHIVLNGDSLKRIFLKYNDSTNDFNGSNPYYIYWPVVERIGGLGWFFPVSRYVSGRYNCLQLRCYEDENFPLHNFKPSVPCDFTVGLDKMPDKSSFQIYPNPAHDLLHVETSSPASDLVILDISGRIVTVNAIDNDRHNYYTLDISNLPEGTYFIRIATPDGVHNRQWIKQ